ncbi:type II toxin-antitoxin system RelE/ParE family toxin [Haloplasma contractile]|uniref:Plasmid stabilization system protein n=1 Tax=Haloplasma contractile SSD-17B TaxID=1033810 RepID=U2FII1_9MOLU|nr:type II toxin-antitoxin system RelE/ParE family toxin [Haloplasma contractile]ERJ11029.1 plasmid stabilization system protein [Haloplasma contractile SSD-17B]
MYEILRTDKADEDLRSIIYFIADDSGSIEVALNYLDKIEKGIGNLVQFPFIGVVPIYKTLKVQNYRVLSVEKHLVFYKVNEASKKIIIYRILSSKQEYLNLL